MEELTFDEQLSLLSGISLFEIKKAVDNDSEVEISKDIKSLEQALHGE